MVTNGNHYTFTGLIPQQVDETDHSSSRSDMGDLEDEPEEVKNDTPQILTLEHLEKLYAFALIWCIGAFLETADRNKYSTYLVDKLNFLSLPQLEKDVRCFSITSIEKFFRSFKL